MNCQRAAAVLRGLEKNALVVESEEIEELLAVGLAVEAEPEDLQMLAWLQPVVREFAGRDVTDPFAAQGLLEVLRHTEEELKKDWYRIKTSKEELARREQSRVTMRRALGYLSDRVAQKSIATLAANSRQLAPGASYVCCEALGAEHYAITQRGSRVRRHLKLRLERFAGSPLKTFLHVFDKNAAKMRAFGAEVTTLSRNIGYVRKNREQVVIGLAKSGVSAAQALGIYQQALHATNNAPDVAVTCARNAGPFGNPMHAVQRLGQARAALQRVGFGNSPVVMGASKSLLPYDRPDAGVPRFIELLRRIEHWLGRAEVHYKYVARLMPAVGTPEEIVRRVAAACNLLGRTPSRVHSRAEAVVAAVALASMVRADDQLLSLVQRFRDIEYELVRGGVSTLATVDADALECVACPGSPIEVVDIVDALAGQIAEGRRRDRADVAVAVAFAKRFAL